MLLALQPFFRAMHRALKPGGVVCTQVFTLQICAAGLNCAAHLLHAIVSVAVPRIVKADRHLLVHRLALPMPNSALEPSRLLVGGRQPVVAPVHHATAPLMAAASVSIHK